MKSIKFVLPLVAATIGLMPVASDARDLNRPLETQDVPAGDQPNQGLSWTTDLKQALADAQKSNKLVFWVQMLGKMDGPT